MLPACHHPWNVWSPCWRPGAVPRLCRAVFDALVGILLENKATSSLAVLAGAVGLVCWKLVPTVTVWCGNGTEFSLWVKQLKKKKRSNSPTLCLLFAGGNSRGQSVFTANNLPSGAALGVFGTDTTHRMIINLRLDVRIALRPTDLEA